MQFKIKLKFKKIPTSSCCVCSLKVTLDERQFGEICVSDEEAPAAVAPAPEPPGVAADEGTLLAPPVEELRLLVANGDMPLATPKLLYAAAIFQFLMKMLKKESRCLKYAIKF